MLEEQGGASRHENFQLGAASVDELLGGLSRGAIHEIHACLGADAAAAAGFALGLSLRASGDKPIVWVRQDALDSEAGAIHAPGLLELGLDPERLILIQARDAIGVLRAGVEALHCAALGAVMIEIWGSTRILDLTAGRKLLLAARQSGVTLFLIRVAARSEASSAETRWSVEAAASEALEANAPGQPAFSITLLRHRAGISSRKWTVEWNRDRCFFADAEALSRREPAIPSSRPLVSEQEPGHGQRYRRTG